RKSWGSSWDATFRNRMSFPPNEAVPAPTRAPRSATAIHAPMPFFMAMDSQSFQALARPAGDIPVARTIGGCDFRQERPGFVLVASSDQDLRQVILRFEVVAALPDRLPEHLLGFFGLSGERQRPAPGVQ